MNAPPGEFDFTSNVSAGLVVCAGGFEQRARGFVSRLRTTRFSTESCLLLRYGNDPAEENEANYRRLRDRLRFLCSTVIDTVPFNDGNSVQGGQDVQRKIHEACAHLDARCAFIDISAMTHLLAASSVHACLSCGLRTTVVYTEAKSYFPTKEMRQQVVRAWRTKNYDVARRFLQSAGLKAVQILPDFSGNFRPGHQTCLVVFAGHEPNRVEGLVDDYAPGALIVLYGVSPHSNLRWRTELSKDLHAELFSQWLVRKREVSTLRIDEILGSLETEFGTIRHQYDVAIAPQCSKMQAIASYLFWRRHPEVQLIFTSPVNFNPARYSHGTGRTFQYEIS